MDAIKFNLKDVEILYSFPSVPSELSTVIRCFTFLFRTAQPTFDEVTSCVSKSLRAGIICESCGKYTVKEDWYRKIHINDEIAENEIESMLLFEESFVGVELTVVNDFVRLFSREHYEMSIKK
ncbi:MAG TPA: hypothetical protein VF941_19335 [Clostridia bacterium]